MGTHRIALPLEMAQAASASASELTGIVKAVAPMHIFNLCLGRSMLPALILDVRAAEDFAASHLVGSFNCPVDSQSPTVTDIEKSLSPTPMIMQRFRGRENAVIAVVGNDMTVVEAVARLAARDVSKSYVVSDM